MKEFIRKALKKMVLFALGDYADELSVLKKNRHCFEDLVNGLADSINELNAMSNLLQAKTEEHTRNIQYFAETLMDKSYWLDRLREDTQTLREDTQKQGDVIKVLEETVRQVTTQAGTQAQTLQYLSETLMDKSYWLDRLREDTQKQGDVIKVLEETVRQVTTQAGTQAQTLQYLSETLMDKSYWLDVLREEIETQKTALRKAEIKLRDISLNDTAAMPKIYQVVPVYKQGDAIGNHALFIDKVLRQHGFLTQIYCEENHSDRTDIQRIDELGPTTEKDIILLHMAAENGFAEIFDAYSAKKVMVYHNVTPDHFFHGFDDFAEISTKKGRQQAKKMRKTVDACITESQYNRKELEEMGYEVPIHVVAIPFNKEEYSGAESESVKERICDGKKNILFVGRIAPNKKFEDLIASYQFYHDNYNADSRLILVGSFNEENRYYKFLQTLIRPEDDIVFTGHVSTEEWITYYQYAHLFLCLSEHEGFCVPIVEAMSHQIPIIAYNSSAVGETMGSGGILLEDKSPDNVAKTIFNVLSNEGIYNEIRAKQMDSLERFSKDKISQQLINIFALLLEEKDD